MVNAGNGGNVIFRGMSPNIPGNVAKHWEMSSNILWKVLKHSGECPQTFRGMSPNIPGNVLKHFGECHQTFQGISSNIPRNATKHSGDCPQIFWGTSSNIPGNVPKHSGKYPQTFRGMSQNIPGNVAKLLSLISEYLPVHYVLISSNQCEYLYSFPVCKNVLLADAKETF